MAEQTLDIDLRMRIAAQHRPRLPQNLRQLGAVGSFVPQPAAGSQHTVVKGWITRGQTTGDHLQYLQKDKGRDGADARLFGNTDPAQFAQQASQDTHQFRFSVSLREQHPFFALQPYIETLMARVEKDLGRPLEWVGAVHHDTAHPHAHVVLRGADREGQPLYIKNDYLTHGLRYRASQIATWLLGPERSPQRTIERAPSKGLGHKVEQHRGQEMGL